MYFYIQMVQRSINDVLDFMVSGKVYQFHALPFGMGKGPLIFTDAMNGVATYACQKSVHMHIYLGDW